MYEPLSRTIPVEELNRVLAGVMWIKGYFDSMDAEMHPLAAEALRKLEEWGRV